MPNRFAVGYCNVGACKPTFVCMGAVGILALALFTTFEYNQWRGLRT